MRKPTRASRLGKVALVPAFFRYLRDREASTLGKFFIFAAAAYVIMPLDAIPDIAPVIGWLDDLGVATLAFLYLSRALAPYRQAPAFARV